MAKGALLLVLISATMIVVPICMALLLDWCIRRFVAPLDDPVAPLPEIVLLMGALLVLFSVVNDVDPDRCDCEACLRELPEWRSGYTVGPFTAPVGKEPGDLTPQQALEVCARPYETSDERTYGAERRAT